MDNAFLGFLPPWVGDFVSIVAIALGLPGILLWLLGRKDANRKLIVEEGGLKKSVFDSQTETYQDLLDRKDRENEKLTIVIAEQTTEIKALHREGNSLRDIIWMIRDLFNRVVSRNQVQLTPEEQTEFDRSRPKSTNYDLA